MCRDFCFSFSKQDNQTRCILWLCKTRTPFHRRLTSQVVNSVHSPGGTNAGCPSLDLRCHLPTIKKCPFGQPNGPKMVFFGATPMGRAGGFWTWFVWSRCEAAKHASSAGKKRFAPSNTGQRVHRWAYRGLGRGFQPVHSS